MTTSEQIVSINNQIDTLSKALLDNLLNMEVNDKKFRLLKKEIYRNYFETAKKEFCIGLEQIIILNSSKYKISSNWQLIHESFESHSKSSRATNSSMEPAAWADDYLIEDWTDLISKTRNENQKEIEQSLIKINHLGRQSVKNSLIGLGVSIFAGILGAWFIAKSMINPLKRLKNGLLNVSNDNNYRVIKIDSNDEFSELAGAFNDMTRQLKEDEDSRSDFIAILSHEIRTPLSSIRESVNMIVEEVLGPVNNLQKKFMKIASAETIRISDLLNHLLDVSMLESNSGKIDPEPLDPNQLISEVSKGLLSKEKISNVDIKFNELSDPPMVMGVKKEIMQVLLNIIGNAIKFSSKGRFVEIFLLNNDKTNSLTFKISDQGPGIPEEEKSLIFKKYYRSKKVRSHMDGVGLGLNISKRIINAHGGIIYMKNNKDKGSSFFFTLPTAC